MADDGGGSHCVRVTSTYPNLDDLAPGPLSRYDGWEKEEARRGGRHSNHGQSHSRHSGFEAEEAARREWQGNHGESHPRDADFETEEAVHCERYANHAMVVPLSRQADFGNTDCHAERLSNHEESASRSRHVAYENEDWQSERFSYREESFARAQHADFENEDRHGERHSHYEEAISQSRHADYENEPHSREHGHHSSREKSHDRDRENERSFRYRHSKDRDRDRRAERDRDRDRGHYRNRDMDRSRDRERHGQGYDYDRERRHRHRARSRSRGRSRDHIRSHSPPRSKSRDREIKKQSGFDMAPATSAVVPGGILPGQLPSALPGMFPPIFSFAGAQFGGFPRMPIQAVTQQATRNARRVYVGGLPLMANEQTIATFFSQVMTLICGNTAGPGDAVVNVYINHEKKFAFVEMRTVEEASNAMALDGILFEGAPVRVRRPSDYNPTLAAALGPCQPSPFLNLAAVGLTPGAVGGADGPDRIFVGGLPYYLTESQIKELLESFGPLRGFDLVKDRETGNSKGYAFCVYQDPAVTDMACSALNGLKMGDKTLTVRRATASGQPKPDQADILIQAQQQIAIQKFALEVTSGNNPFPNIISPGLMPGMLPDMMTGLPVADEVPSRVICLSQAVSADELKDDKEFEEIFDDMKDECGRYGSVTNLLIPRPSGVGEEKPGVGKVFVEYSDIHGSSTAKENLNGRKFAGNLVTAVYYPEDKFLKADYSG